MLKKINRYWVDENNNRWNIEIYTEEQAEKYSKSLVNCYNCINCINCRNCLNCNYCDNCSNYKSNPQKYTTKEIGSRDDQITFYYGKTKIGMELQVVCGCFRGNLEKFKKSVLETHKDNDLYRKQYLKEIEKVKVLFDLEDK